VLLMVGLNITPGASAALLLNLEGVFTALLAWWIFKENTDARIVLGMVAISAGGVILSWDNSSLAGGSWLGGLAIAGACLGWGVDNNLTRNVATGSPVQIAALKGGVAGMVNISLGLLSGSALPPFSTIFLAGLVGLLGYGVSLTLFIAALGQLGTARTGAYFATAPFVGAALAVVLLREPISMQLLGAAALMGVGVGLHLTEHHEHEHSHEVLEHEHPHSHDEHHQHDHEPGIPVQEPHTHVHTHPPLVHSHPHYPDIHHRHSH
jgi:drug/metabolite transporter (DMT)-like permease